MASPSNLLFSEILSEIELNNVNFYSYFPVIESGDVIKLAPSDHAIHYPLEFTLSPRKAVSGDLNFYNTPLFQNLNTENLLPENAIVKPSISPIKTKCLIVNVLDNCYGHAFCKVLNLYNLYQEYHVEYDIFVITHAALEHLIPADKFIICSLKLGFTQAQKSYSLKNLIAEIKSKYSIVDYPVVDTDNLFPAKKALVDFFTLDDFESQSKIGNSRCVTFYYRADFYRTWGGSRQSKYIIGFFENIKKYFNSEVKYYVVGDKDNSSFPEWIIDARAVNFTKNIDYEYNVIFKNSLYVVGLVGSNMLAPSLLSAMTIHLVPEHKVHITADEIVNSQTFAVLASLENIYLFGNEFLTDLSPESLANRALILYQANLIKAYKFNCLKFLRAKKEVQSQKDYISTEFPYFHHAAFSKHKNELEMVSYKKMRIPFLFNKLLKKLNFL
jgi:hypothetical protein